jgi:hypothetical protein
MITGHAAGGTGSWSMPERSSCAGPSKQLRPGRARPVTNARLFHLEPPPDARAQRPSALTCCKRPDNWASIRINRSHRLAEPGARGVMPV